ncbi:MAG: Hsp20/alpha crystallin family protein [Anaerolineae bacterium]
MSLDRWEPFREFMTLREAMDRLFEESLVNWRRLGVSAGERTMRLPIDAYATDNEIVIIAPVPGVNPEEVEITLEGDTLTIKGEIKPPLENVDYIFQERAYGPFSRTLTLNVPVDAEKAEATFENGILTLTIPKAESVKPKTIKVKSK